MSLKQSQRAVAEVARGIASRINAKEAEGFVRWMSEEHPSMLVHAFEAYLNTSYMDELQMVYNRIKKEEPQI